MKAATGGEHFNEVKHWSSRLAQAWPPMFLMSSLHCWMTFPSTLMFLLASLSPYRHVLHTRNQKTRLRFTRFACPDTACPSAQRSILHVQGPESDRQTPSGGKRDNPAPRPPEDRPSSAAAWAKVAFLRQTPKAALSAGYPGGPRCCRRHFPERFLGPWQKAKRPSRGIAETLYAPGEQKAWAVDVQASAIRFDRAMPCYGTRAIWRQ